MKEKIGRLARGLVDSNPAVIHISPEVIDENLTPGEIYKSEIHLASELRTRFRGLIYSSNPRVRLTAETYSGHFAYIGYSVDTSHLDDGDIISGRFSLVTSSGERVIPYLFTIKDPRNKPETTFRISSGEKTRASDETRQAEQEKNPPVFNFNIKNISKKPDAQKIENDTPRRLLAMFKKSKVQLVNGSLPRSVCLQSMQKTIDRLYRVAPETKGLETLVSEQQAFIDDTYREYKATDAFNAYRELRFKYDKGDRRPELFAAACGVLSESLAAFSGFDDFTLMTLNYGTRYNLLSGELLELVSESLVLEKEEKPLLIILLKRAYKYHPNNKILTYICNYYIKHDRTDVEAFAWYDEGVSRDAQSALLYDYYLGALPDNYDKALPEEVYLYFSFNSPVSERSKKLLYLSVVNHFAQDSETAKKYDGQISEYLTDKLLNKTPDLSLAPIYQRFINENMIDGKTADAVSDIIMCRKLTDIPEEVRSIVITYDELLGSQEVPVTDGCAVFPLYTAGWHIYFISEDGAAKETTDVVPELLVKNKEYLLEVCRQYYPDMPSYLIENAYSIMSKDEISEDDVNTLSYLAMAEGITPAFKTKINSAIILKYNWSSHTDSHSALLESGRDRGLSGKARIRYIDALIEMGEYEEAETQIKRLGIERISSPSLLAVIRNSIIQNDFEKDDYLLNVSWGLFLKGISDDITLNYLCKNYNGLVSEMKELLVENKKRGGQVYDLPERLLSQMLFVNNYNGIDEVFRAYASEGTVQKNLLFAYYVVKCSLYLLENEKFDPEIFDAIKRTLSGELMTGSAPVIMQLAVSKYFSNLESLNPEDELICRKIVALLTQRGIILPYFKKLSGLIELPQEIKDKTFVSYQGKEDEHVTLELWSEEDDEDPVILEMTYVYAGIFIKPVLLFDGEHLSYKIRVTRDEVTTVVEEGELTADITLPDEDRKFAKLNRLITGSAEPNDEAWQKQMQEFSAENELTGRLFG